MKNIKLGKKEYVVIEKSKLDRMLVGLSWRIKAGRANTEVIKYIDNKYFINTHSDHSVQLLNECEAIIHNFSKEF